METYKAQPPKDMPSDTVCIVLQVPNSPQWLSALWWVLDQYNYWFNWEKTSDKRGVVVARRWRQMFWQARSENAMGQDCEALIVKGLGIELGEDISMQIRISPDDSCIIQMWCIDHWEDWYDPRLCIVEASTQPPPGGELASGDCATYNVTLRGNEKYLLPVPVEAGYTIEISSASGGWWDGNVLHAWNCPNGQTYALGLCASTGASDAGSPIPSQPIGRLIAQIDTDYYDAYNQTIIVPTGVVSSDLYFQMNDASLSDNQGSVSFQVRVCNAGVQYEQFTMDSATNTHETGFSTIADETYRITIDGEVCHNPSNTNHRHDAIWISGDNWATHEASVACDAAVLYGVLINGQNIPSLPYSASHHYVIVRTGDGNPLVFKPVCNSPYTSCGGSFTVTVEKL